MLPNTWVKSEYVRNVLTLMSGTSIAQAIPVIVTPVLTRIYSPAEFGLFGVYMALILIGGMIATGRLEMAVLIARKDNDALQLATGSIMLSGLFSAFVLIIVILWGEQLAMLSGQPDIKPWLYIVPCSIFLFSTYKMALYWLNRKKHYGQMSQTRVIQSSSISTLQIVIGFFTKMNAGLAIADCVGRAIALILIFSRIKHSVKLPRFSWIKQVALLKRYRKFPLLGSPASLLNTLSLQMPYLIIPALLTSAVAGLYFLVFRVLMMPVALLGEAMMEVFRKKALEHLDKQGTCRPVFVKTLLFLTIVGLPPMALLVLLGQELFAFIFGEEWREAGFYASLLAPMAFLRLVCAPLSGVLLIREKLQLIFWLQFLFFVMVAVSLILGWLYQDPIILVASLSISGCLFYLLQAINSFRFSAIDNAQVS